MQTKNTHLKTLVATGFTASAFAAGSAMAADTVDTAAIISTIQSAGVAAAAIGVAVLSMHYGIKLYKWIKAAG
ncbi:fluoride ion exporter CrcB/FEX [Luteibacter sp. Sphag1AF]|uniref:major capsid protein n=1 Tax=Luteibacter sp. Sphag1AF TaxID=2587031 RepID=UPI0016076DF7|nr:major capsid protein [Luteibacter sp. Sphag1AF]MBB3228187.1 fluoride ion exporter CrcB/FEX [Luteibacter sp. Sphag1AF]